jgi:hypothetical protein
MRYHGPCHQHIEAADSHRPKCFDSILKLDKLHIQILALPELKGAGERELAVDRDGVHVPNGHFISCRESWHFPRCRETGGRCESKKRAATHHASPIT